MMIDDINNKIDDSHHMGKLLNKKISNEQISMISTGSSEGIEMKVSNEVEMAPSDNQRFSLRKRRNINYNFKTKRFEYDEDSDYEEKQKKKGKRKPKKVNKETTCKKSKDSKLRVNSSPRECREFQLSGLLNWKNYDVKEEVRKGESEYIELEDVVSVNLEKYAEELEAILINPPWSNNKTSKFDFSKFSKMKLPLNKMKEGLIFVWTEKEHINDVVNHFENMKIKYVENVAWFILDPRKKENFSSPSSDLFNINDLFKVGDYKTFSKSHLTLLIFRKFLPTNKRYLELRHQRTGDAVFDYDNPEVPFYRPFFYIYRLIEILLPKANYKQGEPLKMMEIFSRKDFQRKGWIHIAQK